MCGRAGERVVRPLGKTTEPQMWLSGGWHRVSGDQIIGITKVACQGQAARWLELLAARCRCAVAACGWWRHGGSRWLVSPSLGMYLVGSVRAGNAMVMKTWAVRRGGSRHSETAKA